MILSNPQAGILNETNKNQGANPYAQQAAGMLQQYMAQQAQQAQLYAQAAARNQQEANKGGASMGQFANGLKKLLGKQEAAPTSEPLTWENAAPPTPMDTPLESDVPLNSVGNMTPVKPSATLTELLPKLAASAKATFPDNPTMQQVSLSQAILESGLNGKPSELATQHNNYFGIKSSKSFPGTDGSVDYGTTEFIGGAPARINQGFARNSSMDDSFRQYGNLMNGSSRYAPVIAAKSPLDAFSALGKSGYATDPNYAAKLRAIHSRYVSPYYG